MSATPIVISRVSFIYCIRTFGFPLNPPCSIRREGGRYREVQVHWAVVDVNTGLPLPDGGDFEVTTGNVTFADLQVVAPLEIRPNTDSAPEYEETFRIILTHVTGRQIKLCN